MCYNNDVSIVVSIVYKTANKSACTSCSLDEPVPIRVKDTSVIILFRPVCTDVIQIDTVSKHLSQFVQA